MSGGFFSATGMSFVSISATLLLTPVILRYIGQSAYGLWATFGSVIGYFGLFDFGMNYATVKYTAEFRARADTQALTRLISTMVVGIACVGLAIITVSFGVLPLIPKMFHLDASLVSTAQIAFAIMASNVALGLVGVTFNNVIYGFQRVDVIKSFGIIQSVINFGLTLLLLRRGFGLIGVVLASGVAVFTVLSLSLIFLYRSNYGFTVRPRFAEMRTLKAIAPYSLRSFILGLTAQVIYRTDNIVIGVFLTIAAVAPYSIAYKLCFLGAMVMFKVSDTLFPTFTRLYTLGDIDGLRSLYLRTLRLAMCIIVPFALILVFAGMSTYRFVGRRCELRRPVNFIGPRAHGFASRICWTRLPIAAGGREE